MLKALGLILFLFSNLSWAIPEPEKIFIVVNGKVEEIHFSKLKRSEITATNYHPNFVDKGKITYSGYLIKDVLKGFQIGKDQPITIIGKTGQFSIELLASELLSGQNLIATHVNGEPVKTEENGLQIIYDDKTTSKYPHLKQRQFWCWWIRSFVLDEKFKPSIKLVKKTEQTFKTELPWPTPYGISSKSQHGITKERSGSLLGNFKKISVELLNGHRQEILPDGKSKYLFARPINNKAGAYSLHQLIEKDGKIETIVSNLYYIKSLEVIQ